MASKSYPITPHHQREMIMEKNLEKKVTKLSSTDYKAGQLGLGLSLWWAKLTQVKQNGLLSSLRGTRVFQFSKSFQILWGTWLSDYTGPTDSKMTKFVKKFEHFLFALCHWSLWSKITTLAVLQKISLFWYEWRPGKVKTGLIWYLGSPYISGKASHWQIMVFGGCVIYCCCRASDATFRLSKITQPIFMKYCMKIWTFH